MHKSLFAAVLVALCAVPAAGQAILFTSVSAGNPDGEPYPGINSYFNVSVDQDALALAPATVTIDLPSGVGQVTLTMDHFEPLAGFGEDGLPLPGTTSSDLYFTWTGTGDGYDGVLVNYFGCTGGKLNGAKPFSLTLQDGATATLSKSLASQHVLRQVGTPLVPVDAPEGAPALTPNVSMVPPPVTNRTWASPVKSSTRTHSFTPAIDILVFYTDLALSGAETTLNIECIAAQGVAEISRAFARNDIDAVARLAGTENLPGFDESGLGPQVLTRLQEDVMVRKRRRETGADAVMLLIRTWRNATGCGIAFVQRPGCGNEDRIVGCDMGMPFAAFAMFWSAFDCVRDYGNAVHEFGHLASAEHQPGKSADDERLPYLWSHAYAFPPESPTHQTAVYSGWDYEEVPYFSTPDIVIDGEPIGAAGTNDNAQAVSDRIDDLSILGDVVFANGFEEGTTDAWSLTEGGAP